MALKYHDRNLANIAKLADNTRSAATKLHEYCEDNGLDILIYETIRTKAQQEANVKNGASQTMKSYHLVGQALDFVMVDSKGNTLWNGYGSADAKKVISYAKKLGFEWGGDWKDFVDKPHLQFNYKGYGTDTFGKTVTVSKPSASTTATKTVSGIKQVGTIKVSKVNNFTYIYEKTSDTSKQLGQAKKNSTYPIAGSTKDWYEVIYKGKRAYIKAKYCSKV